MYFIDVLELISSCTKEGLLVEQDGKIAVYREAKGEYPEGWYLERIHDIAQELMNDTQSLNYLISELEKKTGEKFEPHAYESFKKMIEAFL